MPDKGWVKLTKLESCEGEASVSNRKGKRIVAYELNVKVTWKGSVDYDDVEGSLLLPYISEDVTDGEYEVRNAHPMEGVMLLSFDFRSPAARSESYGCTRDAQIKWTAKEPNDTSHKMALRYMQKQTKTISERLKTFYNEINAK